jgi:hypothetical protein
MARKPSAYAGVIIYSRLDAERANCAAGCHFFDAGTLKFFHSRISERFYLNVKTRESYFVSSEQDRAGRLARRYTVRAISWDTGKVRTIDSFQGYSSNRGAHLRASGMEQLA